MLQTVAELAGKPYRWPDRTCMALTERMAGLLGAPAPTGYAEYLAFKSEARPAARAIAIYGSLAAAHEQLLARAATAAPASGDYIPGDIAILGGKPGEQISGLVGTDFMVWTMTE